ncbi:D-alanyl-D-alanine carboxypeptidase [Streptomyces sp. NPDC102270]|uniref:D-alanyl-D-alanine carboxypeptidase n=1 Tax=Streptomyces sp. NPDC102270 TaxID=3366150 RepID=UPI0037FD06AD
MTDTDHLRHMEEASVAGESPDRSKQRESSAEPTSGSGSPVPGARSSAPDPRLAVARESISLAGIDTATRVFSVRDLPKTPEDGAGGPAEAGTGGSGSAGAGDTRSAVDGAEELEELEDEAEAGKSAGEADAEEEAGGAENETGAEAGGSDAAEDTGTAEPRDDVDTTGDSGDPGTAGGPDDAGTGDGGSDAAEDTGTAELRDDVDTTGDSGDSGTAGGPDDAGTGDGLSGTGGAAEGSEGPGKAKAPGATGTAGGAGDTGAVGGSGDTGTAEAPGATGAVGGSGAAEDSGDTSTDDSGTAEVSDDASTSGGSDESGTAGGSDGPDTGSGDSGTGESDESAPSGDARLRDAVAAWVATGDGAGPTEGSGKAEAAEKAAGQDGEPAEDEPGPDTGSKTGSEPTPAPESDAAEKAVAEEAPADDEDQDPDTGDSTPSGARGTARPAPTDPRTDHKPGQADVTDKAPTDSQTDDEAGDGDADVADAPPVDQPTAVFKAPRPPVDQPTTMLKLGKAPEAAPKTEPKPKPETPAERTSKFVALKGLDEPREARPKVDATAAVPQVGPERTTQQPLPPKPPLDLLAELTNTPPPPPSPLRTLGRRVKIWTPILILLVVAFAIAQALRPLPDPTLSLTAKDSYTFDGSKAPLPWPTQGQGWMDVTGIGTMGDFGKQTPVAIGSVAKAMTAYIVLKDHPLKSGEEGAKITVDALAEKEGGYNKQGESTLNTVKQGDVLTQKQAISAIMIPSANNIARLLARWDAGSEAAFIKKMNDTAKELGMKNTKYTDASGLKETTVSTAEDQVKLGNELVKIPALMEITKLPYWFDPSGQKWRNYNELVPFNGAIGIKTGTTSAAGGNLLFAATKEVGGQTVTVVGAILGQHTAPIIDTVNAVSKTAMLAARDALTSTKILKKGDVVGYVDDGLGGQTPVVLTKDVTAIGWAGYKVKLSFAADDVPHTAKAGTKVGSLTVGDGEGGAVKVPVTLQKDLTEPGLTDKLTRVG